MRLDWQARHVGREIGVHCGAPMLDRKLYQLQQDQAPVWIFLSDQQRWIEQAEVVEVCGGLVTLRYETDEDDELQAWEELVRIEAIGSVMTRLSGVCRSGSSDDLPVSDDCPEAEQLGRRPAQASDGVAPLQGDERCNEPGEA